MRLPQRSVLVLGLAALLAARVDSAPQPPLDPTPTTQRQFTLQIVALTNAERAKVKLAPLKLQENLCTSAQWMAQDMADHDYFDHTDHQGRGIDPRIPSFGYDDYETLCENIAGGQTTPADVLADWMKSPGHRANLLDPHLREVGVGIASNRSSRFKNYWVEDFGSRFHIYPLVVNDGSGRTKSTNTHLTVYGEGWAKKMRFSNDGVTWTEWEAYRANRDWTLTATPGKHTVYAELSDDDAIFHTHDEVELIVPTATTAPARTASASH